MAGETFTISTVASLEPQIVAIESVSNEPTFSYGVCSQHPVVPPSLNDLSFAPNPFNVLATMAVIRADEDNSPQSPELSIPSPIPPPLRILGSIEGCETTHTSIDDNTFHSDDDPRQVYGDISASETFDSNESRHLSFASTPSSTLPPLRRQKRKLSMGVSFLQKRECRSTPARHDASPYQPKRHPDDQEKLKH